MRTKCPTKAKSPDHKQTETKKMIEPVSDTNLEEVLPLIRAYQEFYLIEDICDSRNREFFSQFGTENPTGCQFLFHSQEHKESAEPGKQVAGFATVYFSYVSSITAKVAVLNDLYTVPKFRGQGIATALIEHCRKFAASKDAVRLQWVTAHDNLGAQKLYESLDTNKSSWHFYTYSAKSE